MSGYGAIILTLAAFCSFALAQNDVRVRADFNSTRNIKEAVYAGEERLTLTCYVQGPVTDTFKTTINFYNGSEVYTSATCLVQKNTVTNVLVGDVDYDRLYTNGSLVSYLNLTDGDCVKAYKEGRGMSVVIGASFVLNALRPSCEYSADGNKTAVNATFDLPPVHRWIIYDDIPEPMSVIVIVSSAVVGLTLTLTIAGILYLCFVAKDRPDIEECAKRSDKPAPREADKLAPRVADKPGPIQPDKPVQKQADKPGPIQADKPGPIQADKHGKRQADRPTPESTITNKTNDQVGAAGQAGETRNDQSVRDGVGENKTGQVVDKEPAKEEVQAGETEPAKDMVQVDETLRTKVGEQLDETEQFKEAVEAGGTEQVKEEVHVGDTDQVAHESRTA